MKHTAFGREYMNVNISHFCVSVTGRTAYGCPVRADFSKLIPCGTLRAGHLRECAAAHSFKFYSILTFGAVGAAYITPSRID